jgi:hypothetical protein
LNRLSFERLRGFGSSGLKGLTVAIVKLQTWRLAANATVKAGVWSIE